MSEHRIFKTEIIPVLLMITGLKCLVQDLGLAIAGGICMWLSAVCIDRFLKRR